MKNRKNSSTGDLEAVSLVAGVILVFTAVSMVLLLLCVLRLFWRG